MEVTALVFGILSVALPAVGLLFCIPALILGIMVLVKKKRKGFGISAVVMGGVGLLFQAGIVAAISVPAFINYTKRAKTSEAVINVKTIAEHLTASYDTNGSFPPATDWTPSESCCISPCNAAAFDAPEWNGISLTASNYQYRWTVHGNTAVAEAKGDLDCDGIESLFRRIVSAGHTGVYIGETVIENELE